MTIKASLIAAVALSLGAVLSAIAGAKEDADSSKAKTEYVCWGLPVACAKTGNARVAEISQKLQESLQPAIKLSEISMKENPGCCLWLEIDPWRPNPSQDAYTIIIQPGGGRIMASDERQLEAAVQALLKASRRQEGQIELPIGLMTNYPVIGQ